MAEVDEAGAGAEVSASSGEEVQAEPEVTFGLGDLLRTLLNRQTFPHVLLLTGLALGLYALTRTSDGMYELTSLAYLSLTVGYALTAVLTRFEFVHNWVRTDTRGLEQTGGAKGLILRAMKVWSLPLLLSAVVGGAAKGTLLADPAYATWPALGLAGLFIVWSVGQAASFRTASAAWVSGKAKFRNAESGSGGVGRTYTLHMVQVVFVAVVLAVIFGYSMQDPRSAELGTHARWVGFVLVISVLQYGLLHWMRPHYTAAAAHVGSARFARRWGVLAQVFVIWHILSAWRRFIDPPSALAQLVEESILMLFAVVMAIWALSSRGVKRGSSLFTSQNALFWGLAFGFGYAGSIAMITRLTGGGLATTMGVGHLVTAAALILMHPAVIARHNNLVVGLSGSRDDSGEPAEPDDPDGESAHSEPAGESDEMDPVENSDDPTPETGAKTRAPDESSEDFETDDDEIELVDEAAEKAQDIGSWPEGEGEPEESDWELDESDFDELELLD